MREVLKHSSIKEVIALIPGNEECLIRDLKDTHIGQDTGNNIDVIFVNTLYNSTVTPQLDILYDALAEDGVLIIDSDITSYSRKLQDIGFKSIHVYEEVCRIEFHILVIFTHLSPVISNTESQMDKLALQVKKTKFCRCFQAL